MELPRIAKTLSDARRDLDAWGPVVQSLREVPVDTFSAQEVDAIEGEYSRRHDVEAEATTLLREHLDKATDETNQLQQKVARREEFMSKHRDALSQSPALWSGMKQETENFKALIESIRTLLGSAK